MLIKILRLISFIKLSIVRLFFSSYYKLVILLSRGAHYGKELRITGLIKLKIDPRGKLFLGNQVRINSGNIQNSFGGHRRTVIRVLRGGKLTIGNNVGISNSTIICSTEIEIEDDVLIGGNCHIFDTDFHSIAYEDRMSRPDTKIKKKKVVIKKGAFIGGGSYILKGVEVGEKSIVATGSIVTKPIPDNEIWGGNPAKFIKSL